MTCRNCTDNANNQTFSTIVFYNKKKGKLPSSNKKNIFVGIETEANRYTD